MGRFAAIFVFASQLQSSLEDFRNGGPRPTDRDDLDLHQAFFDARLPVRDDDSLTLRVGRQEMAYGSQRLISARESPNNRLAFDAVPAQKNGSYVSAVATFRF